MFGKNILVIISITCIVHCGVVASVISQSPMTELKGIFSGGERSYHDSRSHVLELMQKVPASVESHTVQPFQLLDFLCLQKFSEWYEAPDHTRDEIFANGILSFAKLGSTVAIETVEKATGRKIDTLSLDNNEALMAIRDRVRPIPHPDEDHTVRGIMKEAEDTSRLDDAAIAEIEKVISPEAMQRIALRHASNPSNVLLIGEYVENLFTSYSEKTAKKLKSVIGDLLQDESPNKDWILSLISELNHSETTRKLYDELLAMIKG